MRLIDANFAVYAAECEFDEEDASKIRWLISHIPTVDAKPVRHGRWVEDRTELVCSVCGARFSDEIPMMNRNFEYADLKFCPECGAKMDAEKGESHDRP